MSSGGGLEPRFSRDGRELFYRDGTRLLVAKILSEEPSRLGKPEVLFERSFVAAVLGPEDVSYDVSADGRFLMAVPAEEHAVATIHVIANWFADQLNDPAEVGRTILGVLGPVVKQIRTKSRVPGELAIKRDIDDGRREELYVPRSDVERRFATLPASYRRPFDGA